MYYICISIINYLFAISEIIPIIMYLINIITNTFIQFLKYLHETERLQIIPIYITIYLKKLKFLNYH